MRRSALGEKRARNLLDPAEAIAAPVARPGLEVAETGRGVVASPGDEPRRRQRKHRTLGHKAPRVVDPAGGGLSERPDSCRTGLAEQRRHPADERARVRAGSSAQFRSGRSPPCPRSARRPLRPARFRAPAGRLAGTPPRAIRGIRREWPPSFLPFTSPAPRKLAE